MRFTRPAHIALLAMILGSASARSEEGSHSLGLITVNARSARAETMRTIRIAHPEEGISPDLVRLLRSATSAEPFLALHPYSEMRRCHPDSAAMFGHCIRGAELDRLVSILLDPDRYSYRTEINRSYRVSDKPVPVLGILFRSGDESAAIRANRELRGFSFIHPDWGGPGAVLMSEVLREVAMDSFPDVHWD